MVARQQRTLIIEDDAAIEYKCTLVWHLAQFLPEDAKLTVLLGLALGNGIPK